MKQLHNLAFRFVLDHFLNWLTFSTFLLAEMGKFPPPLADFLDEL